MAKFKQYKIARRLGARVFSKTENPKFVLTKVRRTKKRQRPLSEFGLQLLEKQKMRYYYGLRERQFSNYVHKAIERKDKNSVEYLYRLLESRLDNVVYRLGFAKTRLAGRQMVNHWHISVNGKRVSIPSYQVLPGDVIGVVTRSREKGFFRGLSEEPKERTCPAWLSLDLKKLEGEVRAVPAIEEQSESLFNLTSVVEFYSR